MANPNENLQDAQKYEINCMGEPTVALRELKIQSKNKRSIILHRHQQQGIPEEMSPYVTSHTLANRLYALKNPNKSNTGLSGDKLMSAKLIRMKELESELNVRRSQLNEVIAENRQLKSLQCRQDHVLKKYEMSQGQLPQLIQSHSEEVKVLRAKCKKISAQNRDLEKRLRGREMELQAIQDQHRHLLKLSKDRHLGEREKLRDEVISLKEMLESMDIQLQELSRKRAIEQKVHQQQLQQEINRSKECRKALMAAEKHIHRLELMLELNEKDVVSGKITANPPKITKKLTALAQRYTLVNQGREVDSQHFVDLNLKQDNEKRSKPNQTSERKHEVCVNENLGFEEERNADPSDQNSGNKKELYKNVRHAEHQAVESVKTTEVFYLPLDKTSSRESKSSESHREKTGTSDEESEVESDNEEICSAGEEREIKDGAEKSSKTEGIEKPSVMEDERSNLIESKEGETPQTEGRIDSIKKVKLLRALRVIDNEESSDSDTSDMDSGLSTSQTKSKCSEKASIKSTSGISQCKTSTERRHSIGSNSSALKKTSSVRHTVKTDLMHELFGTLPNSKTKILKKKSSDTSINFLKDISS